METTTSTAKLLTFDHMTTRDRTIAIIPRLTTNRVTLATIAVDMEETPTAIATESLDRTHTTPAATIERMYRFDWASPRLVA